MVSKGTVESTARRANSCGRSRRAGPTLCPPDLIQGTNLLLSFSPFPFSSSLFPFLFLSLFSILDPEIHDAKRGGAKLRKRSRAVEPAGSEEALISHGEQGRAARQLELPRWAGAHGPTRSKFLAMESGTTRRNGRSSFKKIFIFIFK